MKMTPDILIALILVAGCLVLLILKIDGEIKSILTLAAGWAFASSYRIYKGKK